MILFSLFFFVQNSSIICDKGEKRMPEEAEETCVVLIVESGVTHVTRM